MRNILWFFCCTFLFGCNADKKQNEDKEKIVYDMYEPSEMATLMNQMYDYNLSLKTEIQDGKIPSEFPLDFLKIHTAELSDFKARNATFKSFSKLFIDAEKEIFNKSATTPITLRFNNAVGLCISCHQTECTGPIPRIKKLLIK